MEDKKVRNFTIQGSDIGFTGGLYKGSSPSAAGRKAGSRLFNVIQLGQKYNSDKVKYAEYAKFAPYTKYANEKVVKFILRETTRGSKKESFSYEAHVQYLKTPRVVKRGGIDITVTKAVTVESCKDLSHA